MLKNIVALVTGGASGMGRATVERITGQGGKAVICDLPTSHGAELAGKLGSNSVFCPVDVTSESDVENSLKVTKDKFGRLDVVVNCAGVSNIHSTYHFEKKIPHSLERFKKVLAINTSGTFNVIRLAVRLIAENEPNSDGERGLIINVSSILATDGQAGTSAYSASKGAVASMTLPLAREFGPQGIRVCAISPGFFDTPMVTYLYEETKEAYLKATPFPKRFAKPHEFASLVEFIIENPFINGEVIRIDGGLRM